MTLNDYLQQILRNYINTVDEIEKLNALKLDLESKGSDTSLIDSQISKEIQDLVVMESIVQNYGLNIINPVNAKPFYLPYIYNFGGKR